MPTATAIVTGAANGLGRAIATELGRVDIRVVCAVRDGDAGETVAAEIRERGGEAVSLRTDVRDEYDVERCCEIAARESDGGVDAVVPAAAVDHSGSASVPVSSDSYAAFDDQLRTNARGVYATVREAIPHLADGARVTVPVHDFGGAGGGTYGVSRAATVAVIRRFARELPGPVCGVDPAAPVPAFARRDDLDPSEGAAGVRWAIVTAEPEAVDGQVMSAEAWRD